MPEAFDRDNDATESLEDSNDLLSLTPHIPSDELQAAALLLEKSHLAVVDRAATFPVPLTACAGIPVGCLTLSRIDTSLHVNAVCIVKTGSVNNYLAHDVLHLLGFTGSAQEYRIMCQGEEHIFRRREDPRATSIIGVNFLNQHSLVYGPGSGYIYKDSEELHAEYRRV